MQNPVPHPRHRSVCHPAVLAIAPARVPHAPGEDVPVDRRAARGPQRTGHGQGTGRQDGVCGPAPERTGTREPRTGACPARGRRPRRTRDAPATWTKRRGPPQGHRLRAARRACLARSLPAQRGLAAEPWPCAADATRPVGGHRTSVVARRSALISACRSGVWPASGSSTISWRRCGRSSVRVCQRPGAACRCSYAFASAASSSPRRAARPAAARRPSQLYLSPGVQSGMLTRSAG